MRGGALRNSMAIQRQIQMGVSSINEPIFVWQTWRAPYCEVEVRRGKEQFNPATKQRFSEEVWKFRVRYDEVVGLDTSMRVLYDGMTFNIKASLPDGHRHVDCVIECTVQGSIVGDAALKVFLKENIPVGEISVGYPGFTVQVTGGVGPYIFGIVSGTLPFGLFIQDTTGLVFGTPTNIGTYEDIVLGVTDADGNTAQLPPIVIVITAATPGFDSTLITFDSTEFTFDMTN